MRSVPAFLLAVALAGCAAAAFTQGVPTRPPDVARRSASAVTPARALPFYFRGPICALGDSITADYEDMLGATPWPYLAAAFDPNAGSVVDAAVTGVGLAYLQAYEFPALPPNCGVVFIHAGTNDTYGGSELSWSSYYCETPAQFIANYVSLIAAVRARYPRVYIVASTILDNSSQTNPATGQAFESADYTAIVQENNANIRMLPTFVAAPYHGFYPVAIADIDEDERLHNPDAEYNWIHPNALGLTYFGEGFANAARALEACVGVQCTHPVLWVP